MLEAEGLGVVLSFSLRLSGRGFKFSSCACSPDAEEAGLLPPLSTEWGRSELTVHV